jgi:hypothetical protein
MRLIMGAEKREVFGKQILPGEEFEVPDGEARAWIKMGWAKEVPVVPSRKYARRDMRAEDE